MSNSRPYFVWTHNYISKIDLSKAIRLKKYRTGENTNGHGIYHIEAVYPDNEADEVGGIHILEVGLSDEEATKYIDNLTALITSNRRDTDGRPMITETVSPKAFRMLAKKAEKLQTGVELHSERFDNLDMDYQNLQCSLEEIASEDSRKLVDAADFGTAVNALMAHIACFLTLPKETEERKKAMKKHFDALNEIMRPESEEEKS